MINAFAFFRVSSIKQYTSLGDIWSKSMKIEPESFLPIHVAAYFGILFLTSHLLQKGVNVNAADLNGRTPLYWATKNEHKEMVRFLVASRADVDTRNAGGDVYGKVVRFLVESGTGVDMGLPIDRRHCIWRPVVGTEG